MHCVYRGTGLLGLFQDVSSLDCSAIGLVPYRIRRLKLLTGVDTSTRPVSKSGNDGKRQIRSSRSTKAAPKTATFRRSTAMTERRVGRELLAGCWSVVLLFQLSLKAAEERKAEEPRTPVVHGPPGLVKKKLSRNFLLLISKTVWLADYRTATDFTMAKIKKKGMLWQSLD